jgi:hypothetical protein
MVSGGTPFATLKDRNNKIESRLEMFFCLRAIGFFIKEQRVALVIEG